MRYNSIFTLALSFYFLLNITSFISNIALAKRYTSEKIVSLSKLKGFTNIEFGQEFEQVQKNIENSDVIKDCQCKGSAISCLYYGIQALPTHLTFIFSEPLKDRISLDHVMISPLFNTDKNIDTLAAINGITSFLKGPSIEISYAYQEPKGKKEVTSINNLSNQIQKISTQNNFLAEGIPSKDLSNSYLRVFIDTNLPNTPIKPYFILWKQDTKKSTLPCTNPSDSRRFINKFSSTPATS